MTGRTSLVSPVTERRGVSAGRTAWRQVMRPCLCKEGAQEPLQGAGNVFYSLRVRQGLAEACPARRPVGWRPACRRGPSCTPGGGGQVSGCVPLPLLSLMPGARSPTGQPASRVAGDSFVGRAGLLWVRILRFSVSGAHPRFSLCSFGKFLSSPVVPALTPSTSQGKVFKARNGLQVAAGTGTEWSCGSGQLGAVS